MIIEKDKVVSFHFTLKDGLGKTLETTAPNLPLTYLHGRGQLLSRLEIALQGHEEGDALEVVLPPGDAYGLVKSDPPKRVPRGSFPEHIILRPNLPFQASAPDGDVITLWTVKMEGNDVWVTHQHPLAGVTLHYSIHIVEIREPNAVETRLGRVVAPGFGLSGI